MSLGKGGHHVLVQKYLILIIKLLLITEALTFYKEQKSGNSFIHVIYNSP